MNFSDGTLLLVAIAVLAFISVAAIGFVFTSETSEEKAARRAKQLQKYYRNRNGGQDEVFRESRFML